MTALMLACSLSSFAQKTREKTDVSVPDIASADSAKMSVDSALHANDSVQLAKLNQSLQPVKKKRDWATWRPDTKRAMWLALVLPGAGQIYNRKYWKLPMPSPGTTRCIMTIRKPTWTLWMMTPTRRATTSSCT